MEISKRILNVYILSFYYKKYSRIREKLIEEKAECAINCQGIRSTKTWRVLLGMLNWNEWKYM